MTVIYPNAVIAAFSVNPIMVYGVTASVAMEVKNNDTGKSVRDNREPFDGEVFFDLPYYLQVLFNQEGINEVDYENVKKVMTNSYSVTLTLASANALTFDIIVVWASGLQSSDENLKMFTGYPFTVGVLSEESFTLEVGEDTHSLEAGMYSVPVSGAGEVSTPTRTIKVEEVCGDGIYLRWVDMMGIYRYWMFRKGSVTTKVSVSKEYRRRDTGTSIGIKRTSKEASTLMEVCAPLVDSDTFRMLSGLSLSPLVSMFSDGEWVDVNVEAGDWVRERTLNQDFIATLVLPETIIQKL